MPSVAAWLLDQTLLSFWPIVAQCRDGRPTGGLGLFGLEAVQFPTPEPFGGTIETGLQVASVGAEG